jgi:hypothetical protein
LGDLRVVAIRDLIRGGQLLQIDVLDHVMMGQPDGDGNKGYSSLRELGYFHSRRWTCKKPFIYKAAVRLERVMGIEPT